MKSLLRLTATVALLSACGDLPFTPGHDEGWTVATVEGSIVSSYEGDGRFGVLYPGGVDEIFEIRSTEGRSSGAERIVFERFGSQLPHTGRHWLGEYEDDFFARYEVYRNGRWEWYAAEVGVLDVWSVSSGRIEGEFRFSAVLTCVGDGYTMECDVPPAPDAPRIVVDGSFSAVNGSTWGY